MGPLLRPPEPPSSILASGEGGDNWLIHDWQEEPSGSEANQQVADPSPPACLVLARLVPLAPRSMIHTPSIPIAHHQWAVKQVPFETKAT